jgi:DNA-binding MarR family transcriptional regulator
MEEAELLRRVPNPQDDRSRLLELTEKGAERAAKAGEITACIVEGMGGDLEELLDLRDRVNALRSRMGAT